MIVTQDVMVPMSDGVQLDTLVMRPSAVGQWPTLLFRTPYPELNTLFYSDWLSAGYAVVAQNTRGRYKSQGSDLAFASDGWGTPLLGNHHDGLDTMNWILAQSWCNGHIGTYGGSARGITQNLLAGADPPNLDAQWVEMAPTNFYEDAAFFGGALRQEQIVGWLTLSGYTSLSLDLFILHPDEDSVWDGYSIQNRQNLRNYPVVSQTGWYDTFLQGSINNFTTLRANGGPIAKEDSKLIISLCSHMFNLGAISWPQAAQGLPPGYSMQSFEDRYVKGLQNGFENLPRVAYYLMGDLERADGPGNKWCYADDWPIAATPTSFYFHNDGTMQLDPPPTNAAPVSYQYDPKNAVPTIGGANLILPEGNFDQRNVEARSDVRIYNYGPLTAPVEVVGRLWANVYASSDRVDTDFTAKLTDVYPDGRSILLCDGIRKARFRNGFDQEELMTPGTVYPIPIDLTSTAIVFDVGHTIRVALSSSNAPRYAANPNTGDAMSPWDPINSQIATNSIYMDADHPSAIVFPMVAVQ